MTTIPPLPEGMEELRRLAEADARELTRGISFYSMADEVACRNRIIDRLLRQSSEAAVVEWLRRTAHEAGWAAEKRSPRHFLEQLADAIQRDDHLSPSPEATAAKAALMEYDRDGGISLDQLKAELDKQEPRQ